MHNFTSDFYGFEMKAVVLGYIRPELDYVSRGEFCFAIRAQDVEYNAPLQKD